MDEIEKYFKKCFNQDDRLVWEETKVNSKNEEESLLDVSATEE